MTQGTLARYQGKAGEEYHLSKRQVPESAFGWVARARAEKFQPFVAPSATVLEYGVGLGWNLGDLKCGRKIGFDVAEFLQGELARLGIEFVSSTESLPSQVADVIFCHHVLEHLANPIAALNEMRRLLKDKGRLILVVPAEVFRRRQKFQRNDPNHHLFCWNIQTMGNLVQDCGFEVEQIQSAVYGYDRYAAVKAVRFGLGEGGFRALRKALQLIRPLFEIQVIAQKG